MNNALCHEFTLRGISFVRQLECPVDYKGVRLDFRFQGLIFLSKAASFLN